MIKVLRYSTVFNLWDLPESIFNKVEAFDLKRALEWIPPYIELSEIEYEQIKDRIYMPTIQIEVNDYYGNPSYYSVMPQDVFDALESASLKGEEFADVSKDLFDKMIVEYDKKMMLWENK